MHAICWQMWYAFSYSMFLSSKWTCFRNMLDNQCGTRRLYFIETIFWDKLDNCFISYSPFTSIATGRYLIVFIDFPQIWKSTDEYGKTPFCVWLIYVPGMVFYIFFPPLPAQQKDTFHLARPGFGVSDICSLVVWSPWIEFGWINFHVIFEIGSACPTVRKRWDAGSMGAEESPFSSPALNHCAQRNSLSIRSTCFLDGERYYCDNAYVGDIVTFFLCRYGLSNHLVTSLLEVFFTRCLEHQDNGKTSEWF